MHRRLSTWLFSGCLLIGSATLAADAGPPSALCLPPIFEDGQRLHELPLGQEVAPLWLPLLLRQHEICWRAELEDTVRLVLSGNSAVFGFPMRSRDTVAAFLNQDLQAADARAHVFNLGFMFSYQLKDAVILHEALEYRPDIIVYGVTLADFLHVVPTGLLDRFFESNRSETVAFAESNADGLGDAAEAYLAALDAEPHYTRGWRVSEIGGLLRAIVRHRAEAIRDYFFPDYVEPGVQTASSPPAGARESYSCAATKEVFAAQFRDWQTWNILAYLQDLREERQLTVLIVNWPTAHDPVDDCYNVRYSNDAMAEYGAWLEEEARRRGFSYLDLSTLLPLEDFVDSSHVAVAGQRKIADRLLPEIERLVRDVRRQRSD